MTCQIPRHPAAARSRRGLHERSPLNRLGLKHTMAVASNTWRLERPAASSSAKANDARDVVFTFYQETWADAVGREMYMSGARLLATLMSEPSVRRLLVANPYRSTPIQWARRLSGQRPVPFPAERPPRAGRAEAAATS